MPAARAAAATIKERAARARARAAAVQVAKGAARVKRDKVPLSSTAARDARRVKRGRLLSATTQADMRTAAAAVRESTTSTLVLVHSPACGHCLRLRPAFDEASRALIGAGVQVIEIEAGAMNQSMRDGNPLASALSGNFFGVPHMVAFKAGGADMRTFDGERIPTAIISFTMGRA